MKAVLGQTMIDLVVQQYGTLEEVMTFAKENGVDLDKHFASTEEYTGGQENEVTQFYSKKSILVVNGEEDPNKYPGGAYSDDYSKDYE